MLWIAVFSAFAFLSCRFFRYELFYEDKYNTAVSVVRLLYPHDSAAAFVLFHCRVLIYRLQDRPLREGIIC
jgi:hypothetical protein